MGKYIKIISPLLLFAVYSLLAQQEIYAQSDQPNIILLMADDHRADAVGFKGNPDVLTPRLDELAAQGIIFNRHYASSPICMNSRATVMTGMPEYMTGTGFHHGGMVREIWNNSFVVKLKEAGYTTGFAGKFGFGVYDTEAAANTENIDDWKDEESKPKSDFSDWWGFSGGGNYVTGKNTYLEHLSDSLPHVTRALGHVGKEFIRKHAGDDEPFCLSVWFKAPHKPFDPDTSYDHLFKGRTYAYNENYGMEANKHFSWQAISGRQYAQFTDHWSPDSLYQEDIRKYYQLIYGMDVAIGMIIDEVEAQGLSENTIIIYTSDNGYFTGAHGFQGKTLCYEEAASLPLIIFDPGNEHMGKKLEVNSLTSNEDLAPTIMEMAGLSIPENVVGKSLLPVLNEHGSKIRESLPLINVFRDHDACQALAVVTEDYKYVYWGYESADSVPFPNDSSIMIKYEDSEELYDLKNDRLEMNELSGDTSFSAALTNMRSLYDSYYQHWVEHCVQRNGYPDYDTLFSRSFGLDTVPGNDTSTMDTTDHIGIFHDVLQEPGIVIYPNPVRDQCKIENVHVEKYTIELYDMSGKKVLRKDVYSSSTLLQLSEFPKGMYVIRIEDRSRHKILKNQLIKIE